MLNRTQVVFFILTLLLVSPVSVLAQPAWTIDPFGKEKKPEVYEEKILASEKTATKKFTPMRRFLHNTTTHYNYFFNANNKIKAVIERATLSNQDDFTKLLNYYPYSLENTASQQVELDSVIYKSGAGILLHDLRSDWVDNMYLLIGKAYFFRKELDSAALTFQFINYNLFPRKKNNDDDRIVGSNLNTDDENRAFSIADKENRNFVKKALTRAPSRNESLLWLIRTFIEQKNLGEAAGLISILQNDPNFPKRLHNDLSLLAGYWFFNQDVYDSSAVYLERGLSTAPNKQSRSRWEFLLAQMYEMSGNFDRASHFYAKAAKHTVNPVMDIYANLNNAKMMRVQGDEKELKSRIAKLVKMSRKDKYQSYRDIIFYAAAQLSMDVPDTTAAMDMYAKSIFRYNEANAGYKSRSYLEMANISYVKRDYKHAEAYYDSIRVEDSSFLAKQNFDIEERKVVLKKLVGHLIAIEKQDSLQMVASMPEPQREEYIRKLAKQLRKEKGQKEEDPTDQGGTGGAPISFGKDNDKPQDLFASSNAKGEWYFYNSNARSKGQADFLTKWGKRSNVDNWRRVTTAPRTDNSGMMPSGTLDSLRKVEEDAKQLISYEGLLSGLPLSPEAIDSSNNIIAENLLALALLFQFELDDTEQAINMYELYLERFPDKLADGEVYLGLYYAYNKLGNFQKANYYKDLLNSRFPNSVANKKITDPESLDPNRVDPAVTKQYEDIYNMFIEGNFEQAIAQKKAADNAHGSNYWTPQLLYIEAVYYIKERDDSTAIKVLNRLSVLYPNTPMQQKAIGLIDVLSRRSEIEGYLSALEVTRAEEPVLVMPDDSTDVPAPRVVKEEKRVEPVVKTDDKPVEPIIKEAPAKSFTDGEFTLSPTSTHYVLMVLNKVDGVFQNEARNAFTRYNRELFNRMNLKVDREVFNADQTFLVTSTFENAEQALLYFEKIKTAAPREVSWLPASKYYFLIIDENSLQLLRTNKKLDAFRALLNSAYNNKF